MDTNATNQINNELNKFLLSHNLTKPSEVLRLMADSLVKMRRRKWFELTMFTFGQFREDKCIGCAAAATAINLLGLSKKQLYEDRLIYLTDRAKTFGYGLLMFEYLIDAIRVGLLRRLFDAFGINYSGEYDSRWNFSASISPESGEWKSNLRAIRKTIKELKQRGL